MKIKIELDIKNKIIKFFNKEESICKIDINSSSSKEVEKLNDWVLKKIAKIDNLEFEFEEHYNEETTLYKVAKAISDELKKEVYEIKNQLMISKA